MLSRNSTLKYNNLQELDEMQEIIYSVSWLFTSSTAQVNAAKIKQLNFSSKQLLWFVYNFFLILLLSHFNCKINRNLRLSHAKFFLPSHVWVSVAIKPFPYPWQGSQRRRKTPGVIRVEMAMSPLLLCAWHGRKSEFDCEDGFGSWNERQEIQFNI